MKLIIIGIIGISLFLCNCTAVIDPDNLSSEMATGSSESDASSEESDNSSSEGASQSGEENSSNETESSTDNNSSVSTEATDSSDSESGSSTKDDESSSEGSFVSDPISDDAFVILQDDIDGESDLFLSDHSWNEPWNDNSLPSLSLVDDKTEGDFGIQCDFTQGVWSGYYFKFSSAADLSEFEDGYLKFDIKTIDTLFIGMEEGDNKKDVALKEYADLDGSWNSVSIPLADFTALDLSNILVPIGIASASTASMIIDNVRIEKEGESSWRKFVVIIPDAPIDVSVTASGETTVDVEWGDNSDNETGFNIYWTSKDTKPASPNVSIAANETSYSISAVPGTKYTVWVSAIKTGQESDGVEATASVTTPGDKPLGLRVLSLNILFSAEGIWHWDNRGDNVLKMLDFVDADIIGLQENSEHNPVAGGVSHGFFPSNRIKSDRSEYESVTSVGDMANTILYKKDRFDVVDKGAVYLSVKANWRHASWVLFYDNVAGQHLYFWNTHWNHVDADVDGWKQHGVKMLDAMKTVAHPEYNQVATGDFNSGEWSAGQAYMRNYHDETPDFHLRDTWQDVNGMDYTGAGSYGSLGGSRIDYVFAPEGQWTTLEASVYWTGETVSDHLPVYSVLSY